MSWITVVVFLLSFACSASDAAQMQFSPYHHSRHPTRIPSSTYAPRIIPPTAPPTTEPGQPTTEVVLPTPYPTQAPTPTPVPNRAQYSGGLILAPVPTVYFIYYGDWETTSPGSVAIINEWASNLSNSSLWSSLSTYYYKKVTNGITTYVNVSSTINFGGYVIENTNPYGTTLNTPSIHALIQTQITNGVFPYSNMSVYMVVFSPETKYTYFCAGTCGWHSHAPLAGSTTGERFVFGVSGSCGHCSGCGTRLGDLTPNGNKNADNTLNVVWHEIAEAVTDPYISAWFREQEIADFCQWTYTTATQGTYLASNGAWANTKVGTKDYLVQPVWSNVYNRCVLQHP